MIKILKSRVKYEHLLVKSHMLLSPILYAQYLFVIARENNESKFKAKEFLRSGPNS